MEIYISEENPGQPWTCGVRQQVALRGAMPASGGGIWRRLDARPASLVVGRVGVRTRSAVSYYTSQLHDGGRSISTGVMPFSAVSTLAAKLHGVLTTSLCDLALHQASNCAF